MHKTNPATVDRRSLRLSALQRIDQKCDASEEELPAGRKPKIEDFLTGLSTVERSELLEQLLLRQQSPRVVAPSIDARPIAGPRWRYDFSVTAQLVSGRFYLHAFVYVLCAALMFILPDFKMLISGLPVFARSFSQDCKRTEPTQPDNGTT